MKKIIAVALLLVLTLSLCACASADYNKAVTAYNAGEYEEARELFVALGDYEDSAAMVNACDYGLACQLMEDGDYAEARELFVALGDYENSAELIIDCDYELACQLMDDGKFAEAQEIFETIKDHGDSAEKWNECELELVDAAVQGSWYYTFSTIRMDSEFNNGRYTAKMSVGTSSLTNEGSYRIDTTKKEIYVCYDYIIGTTGKTPNTEEQLMFTYTFEDGELSLCSTNDDILKRG